MSLDEAAEALRTSRAAIDARAASGDLETREQPDGRLEVSVSLPRRRRPSAAPAAMSSSVAAELDAFTEGVFGAADEAARPVPAVADVDDAEIDATWEIVPVQPNTFLPVLDALRQMPRTVPADRLEAPPRRRGYAWAAAAVLAVALGATVAAGTRSVQSAQADASALAGRLDAASRDAAAVTAERDALRARLDEAKREIARAQDDLAVERNVEDTLFKAVATAHNVTRQQGTQIFADGAR